MPILELVPGELTLSQLKLVFYKPCQLMLSPTIKKKIKNSQMLINKKVKAGEIIYGINTGFGRLASTVIDKKDLQVLQRKIVLSHAAGVGDDLEPAVVRLILLLKINSLALGHSGVGFSIIEYLQTLFNAQAYPCVRSQGSVGASGDLAPLADIAMTLIGEGEVYFRGKKIPAKKVLQQLNLKALALAPKEGLALLNGTQVSTALALRGLFLTQNNFDTAIVAGALSVEAARGSHTPFCEKIHRVRNQLGQQKVAEKYRHLLAASDIEKSHQNCGRVQDPYSLRCQPQVMGACLDQIEHVANLLTREANAVTDNPLIFAEDDLIISGGNFHAEPVALCADILALVIAEVGSLAERRIALLIDPSFSGLPAFLVKAGGLNSGFMLAQVTAAALASENKNRATPASIDSLPTSANQEDHVSMATFAARRLLKMSQNLSYIMAIELLAACQGVEFHRPLKTSEPLEDKLAKVREQVPFYVEDRHFSQDIEKIFKLVVSRVFS